MVKNYHFDIEQKLRTKSFGFAGVFKAFSECLILSLSCCGQKCLNSLQHRHPNLHSMRVAKKVESQSLVKIPTHLQTCSTLSTYICYRDVGSGSGGGGRRPPLPPILAPHLLLTPPPKFLAPRLQLAPPPPDFQTFRHPCVMITNTRVYAN